MCPMGNGRALSDDDQAGIVNPGILRNHAPISDPQVPGKKNARRGKNSHVLADLVSTDINNVTVTFATAPATNAYRVTVIG